MRIVIDMQGAQGASRERGIGRYTRSMVREFLRISAADEVFLLFNGMLPAHQELREEFAGLFKAENVRIWYAEAPFDNLDIANAARRELAEFVWEGAIRALKPDYVLLFSMFEGLGDNAVTTAIPERDFGVAVVTYDLIPLIFNEVYLADDRHRHHYAQQLERLQNCDLLFAISEATAKDVRRLLKFPQERVITIGAAVEPDFATRPMPSGERINGLTRPYILYVSGGDERKNQKGLFAAFSQIAFEIRSSYQLVIAGSLPEQVVMSLQEFARSCGLGDDEIIFAPYVDDATLHRLYSECLACIFPSWYEGFGLPILEAMAFKKAVVGSDCSSIPEIITNKEALFDPHNDEQIKEILQRLLTDHKFRKALETEGAKTFKLFDWKAVAKRARTAMSCQAAHIDPAREALVRTIAAIRQSSILDHVAPETISSHLAATFRKDPRRQLLLDISELVQRDARTGIQRVVRSILGSLLDKAPKGWVIQPVYSIPGERGYRYARDFADRFCGMRKSWHTDLPVQVFPGDVFCALDLNHGVLIAQQDILTQWMTQGLEVWTVVYDILPIQFPQYFPDGLEILHSDWIRTLSQFNGALCISKAVADDLMEFITRQQIMTHPRFKIDWFHLGADIPKSANSVGLPSEARATLKGLSQRPSILLVGTVEPRKGHAQSLRAVELLWAAGHDVNLVIVGKEGWRVEALVERLRSHPERGKRLYWLEGISDEYLEQVYQACDVLLAASEGEGFGLPLIEAAQKRIPLLVRDIPVFREVAGVSADYFVNSSDPEVLADTLLQWLVKHKSGAVIKSDDMHWLTWDQSADQFVKRMIL